MPPRHNRTADTIEARGYKTHRVVSVGGPDPVLIAPINAKRMCVYFCNLNDLQGTVIYIGKHDLDDPVEVLADTNGIPLAAGGGDFTDAFSYDAWYGVTPNGALVRLLVIETFVDGD